MENNFKENPKQHPNNQIKNTKKKQKSMRGVSETSYGEVKKNKAFSLTPTAAKNLKELSAELNISASELIERLSRKCEDLKRIV